MGPGESLAPEETDGRSVFACPAGPVNVSRDGPLPNEKEGADDLCDTTRDTCDLGEEACSESNYACASSCDGCGWEVEAKVRPACPCAPASARGRGRALRGPRTAGVPQYAARAHARHTRAAAPAVPLKVVMTGSIERDTCAGERSRDLDAVGCTPRQTTQI